MRMRYVAPFAALVASGLVLTACTGGEDGTGGDDAPLEGLTIMAPYFSPTPPDSDDPVAEALGELAGMPVEVLWVPNSSYPERVNTVLAGDDIPDAIVFTDNRTQSFIQTAEAGGFWDLTEDLTSGEYPNLVSKFPDVQAASSLDGTLYGVYRARPIIRQSVTIRQDWLDNLGLELPETTEDLYEVARAFTEDDPDGNGQDDTYGLINTAYVGPYRTIETWFGSGNVWRDDNGELVPSFVTPEWRQALDYQRDLVQNGYVNPDFATKDPATWNESFLNGEGGIIIDVHSRANDLRNYFRDQDLDPDEHVGFTGQLDGPNGTFAFTNSGFGGVIAITRSSVQTEEQLDQVLTALNAFASQEGQILLSNGIEGDNFTVEDNYAVYNPDRQEFTDQISGAWNQLSTGVTGDLAYPRQPATDADRAFTERQAQIAEEDLQNAYFNPAAGLVSDTFTTNGTQLDNIINDARIQYLAGQIDGAGLDAAIERWRTSGGDQVTTELNELYNPLD